ncbi:MAG: alkaline phosphatase D family protein [Dehalococcoidia bacterium]
MTAAPAPAPAPRQHPPSEYVFGPVRREHLRRLAFVWGWTAFLSFVFFAFHIGPPVTPEGPGGEQIVQRVMLAGGGLGMLIAWRWEGVGGFLLTFAAIVLGVLAGVGFHPLEALLVTIVFLVPGLAFLVLWASQHAWFVMAGTAAIVVAGMGAGGYGAASLYNYYFGPAHPQSTLVALPASPVDWLWSGALTPTSIAVNARLAEDGASGRLAVDTDEGFSNPLYSAPAIAANDTNRVVHFDVAGLEPDTAYRYAVEVDGQLDLVRQGAFRTPADGPTSFTIAVGACSRLGSNGAVYDAIRGLDPLMFIATGDFHYANIEVNEISRFRSVYNETLTRPAQAALFREVPIAYTWDDHDFGGNNSNADSASAPAAQAAYRESVPHYPFVADDGSIYQAFTLGRLRFLLTDSRSDRRGTSMLGEAQTEWLKSELMAAHEAGLVTVWVSSVPWIASGGTGDDWGGYVEERADLANFLAENNLAERLVMLAGDAHMLAIDDGTNSDYSDTGNASFPVLEAAALDRPGSVKGGPYSEGTFPGAGQFALMTVTDDGGDTIAISWQGYNWELTPIVGLDMTFSVPPEE